MIRKVIINFDKGSIIERDCVTNEYNPVKKARVTGNNENKLLQENP